MGFVIAYKTLFEIKLLHHYHLDRGGEGNDYVLFDLAPDALQEEQLRSYDIASFLEVRPSPDTAALLRKHHCVFRRLGDRILVAVKVQWDEALQKHKPFVPLSDDLAFTFTYRITDSSFLNYTGLPLQAAGDTVYFFRNKKEGQVRAYPALSKAAPQQDINTLYSAGELLLNSGGTQVLIAGNITGPVNAAVQDFTPDPQVNGTALSYINRNDLVKLSGNLLHVNTGLQDRSRQLNVTLVNEQGVSVVPRISCFEAGHTIAQVDCSLLPGGLYTLQLEDADNAYNESVSFYCRKETGVCDGIIQIQVKSDDASFDLLDNDGAVREDGQLRSFVLRFKNRATLWRYLGRGFSNRPESGPHLLTRTGFVNLTISNENAVSVTDPPNAGVNIIRTEIPEAAPEHYNLVSEIYLNL